MHEFCKCCKVLLRKATGKRRQNEMTKGHHMLQNIYRVTTALVVAVALLLGAAPASEAQVPLISAELSAKFTGRTGAVGGGTFDGQPADFSASWQTIVDSEGRPVTVIGRYEIVNESGAITVHFVSRLEAFQSETELAFSETWTVLGGSGAYENTDGRGHGTAFIDLAAGPAVELSIELHLYNEPLLCTVTPLAFW